MEILTIIVKVYLILAGISTVHMIGKHREPISAWGAVAELIVLGTFYYLIGN